MGQAGFRVSAGWGTARTFRNRQGRGISLLGIAGALAIGGCGVGTL